MNMAFIITVFVAVLVIVPMIFKVMREYERAVVFTFGRFTSVKGPGLIIMIPLVQQMERVDLRTVVMDDFEKEGHIYIHSETWQARSRTPLKKDDRVKVTAIEGLVLKVEPIKEESE